MPGKEEERVGNGRGRGGTTEMERNRQTGKAGKMIETERKGRKEGEGNASRGDTINTIFLTSFVIIRPVLSGAVSVKQSAAKVT